MAGHALRRVRPAWRTRVAFLVSGVGFAGLLWLSVLVRNDVIVVKGMSMEPLLRPGQLLVLNRTAYRTLDLEGPRRGDVVVFRHVERGYNNEYLVKRVIGLPGELVQVDAGRVFINGTQLNEPYVLAADDYSYPLQGGPARVPEDAYFVLGDNRPASADSHLGWFVRATDLLGQAWPLPLLLPPMPEPTSA